MICPIRKGASDMENLICPIRREERGDGKLDLSNQERGKRGRKT